MLRPALSTKRVGELGFGVVTDESFQWLPRIAVPNPLAEPANGQHAPEDPKSERLVPQLQDDERDRDAEQDDYCGIEHASSAGACQPQ
jgi:hypothetical protein